MLASHKETNLALHDGNWLYIGAQGGRGFSSSKPDSHSLGGIGALKFTGEINSDIINGKLIPQAPKQQLHDLASDPSQKKHVIRDHPEIASRLAARLTQLRTGNQTR